MKTTSPHLLILFATLAGCLGCNPKDPPARYPIGSVRTHAGVTGRSIIELPAGLCVFMHFPPTIQPTGKLIGKIIQPPDAHQIDEPLASFGDASTFNCASFALGSLLDLGPDVWIEPIARSDTFYTVPAEVVLNSYCDMTLEIELDNINWEELATDPALRKGDIVGYAKSIGGRVAFTHMGKIRKTAGRNLLISKLGTGPIVESSLEDCGNAFGFDTLRIYRAR